MLPGRFPGLVTDLGEHFDDVTLDWGVIGTGCPVIREALTQLDNDGKEVVAQIRLMN